jgi:hypothetical protein
MSGEPSVEMDLLANGIVRFKETIYVGDEKRRVNYYMLDGQRYNSLKAAQQAAAGFREVDRKAAAELAKQEAETAARLAAEGNPVPTGDIVIPEE